MNGKINVDEVLEKINDLRFGKLIQYDNPQNQSYGYVDKCWDCQPKYPEKFYGRTDSPTGICQECKENDANKSKNKQYKLKIVSHGIHSLDLFKIQNFSDYGDFKDAGVMFVFESPASNLAACYKKEFDGKYPAKAWWWIEGEGTKTPAKKDDWNKSLFKKYGELLNLYVHTFKLKNAYMTNLIKCGMMSEDNKFGNFGTFSNECKKKCFKQIFRKELEIIKPKVIFTFGNNAKNFLDKMKKDDDYKDILTMKIEYLPHPARRNITNEKRKKELYDDIEKKLENINNGWL